MNQNDKRNFANTLIGVCELYGKQASPEFIALFWDLLCGYELEDIQRAFRAHALNPDAGQFLPKPADIVRYIDGGSQTRAARAWAKVEKAMRTIGGGDSVVFDDPLIHAALDGLGQWPELCVTPSNELQFLQTKFEKRYQALVVCPPSNYPRVLIGRYQAENQRAGFNAAPPMLVGDPGKCRLTYSGGIEPGQLLPVSAAIGNLLERPTACLLSVVNG